jgi:hypothetical protein
MAILVFLLYVATAAFPQVSPKFGSPNHFIELVENLQLQLQKAPG